ncbi:hypothetical protein [Lacinutrix undariae]
MIRRAIILTLILNSIILIGVPSGHGYGFMGFFEFLSIPYLIENGINFQKNYPFESSLNIIGFISLIGKTLLITCLFYKKPLTKKSLIYTGLTLLFIAYIAINFGTWQYDTFLFIITLGSGIPFAMYFGRVIYLIQKETTKLKQL